MPSRISTAQTFNNAQKHVATARERETISAEKSATFKEIVRPSQDPGGWIRAANLKDDVNKGDSIAKNASLATHVLNATETVLTTVQENLQRALELALSASGEGSVSATSRQQVFNEVKNIYDSTVQTLNTRYGNRTLLAGTRTQGAAFDPAGTYLGDGNSIEVEVEPGLVVPVNFSGERAVFGAGLQNGVNILDTLQRLVQGLSTDDSSLIHGTLEDLQKGNEQMSLMRAEVGARLSQIDRALNSHGVQRIQSLDAASKIEEADAIKVFSELARDQAVLQAALTTSQKILNEDPADTLFR